MSTYTSHLPVFDEINFFELTPDLICLAGKDGYFKKVNRAVIDKLGYTAEELFSRPILCFVHEEDRELTQQRRNKLLEGQILLNFENRYVAKNGDIVWLEWTSIYFSDRDVVFAIAKDVTERKRIEDEAHEKYKKFRSLATHFKTSVERDRKHLAAELHEELAQLASVIRMDLDWINTNSPELLPSSRTRVEHALAISVLLLTSIRRISYALSPTMVEDLGLNASCEWLCNEFSALSGIPCKFRTSFHENDLTSEAKTDIFRICQEAMTNVMYHAKASEVSMRIQKRVDKVILTITDDGKGFMVGQQTKTSGLIRMQERADLINGELIIKSNIGSGTKIRLAVSKYNTWGV